MNREMHTHQQSEWGFLLVGSCRVTAVDELGRNNVDDIYPGEGWIFPKNIPHSMQGLHEGCEFLLFFDKGSYSEHNTFSISELFSHLPILVCPKIRLKTFRKKRSIFSTEATRVHWNRNP